MFYIINKDTRQLIRQSESPFNVDESVQPPLPQIQLRHVEDENIPVFNEATEKLNRIFTDDDINFTRTFSYEVVAKTVQEQAEHQARVNDGLERAAAKAELPAMANSTGSAIARQERLERVVLRLAKDILP